MSPWQRLRKRKILTTVSVTHGKCLPTFLYSFVFSYPAWLDHLSNEMIPLPCGLAWYSIDRRMLWFQIEKYLRLSFERWISVWRNYSEVTFVSHTNFDRVENIRALNNWRLLRRAPGRKWATTVPTVPFCVLTFMSLTTLTSFVHWLYGSVRSSLGDEPNRPVKSLMYSCDEIVNQSLETMTINIEIQ